MIKVSIGGSPVDFGTVYFHCEGGRISGHLRYEVHAWDPRVMELLSRKLPFGQALTPSFVEASHVFEVLRGAKHSEVKPKDAAYLARTIEEFCMSRDLIYVRGLASLWAP